MIKINLLEEKRKLSMPVVLGMDLSKVNFKMIIIAIIFLQASSYSVSSYFSSKKEALKKEAEQIDEEIKKIKVKLVEGDKLRKEISKFEAEIERLSRREQQVKTIISKRRNPKDFMRDLPKRTPENVWLNTIELDINGMVKMQGGSSDYASIGQFIDQLNQTIFFKDTLRLLDSKTIADPVDQEARVESFVVSGQLLKME